MGDRLALDAAIRSAKRAARVGKIGLPPSQPTPRVKKKARAGNMNVKKRVGSAFGSDLGQRSGKNEGLRRTTRGKSGVANGVETRKRKG
jgi:hypothetical protein